MRIDPNVVVSPTSLETQKPQTAKPAAPAPTPSEASVVVLSSAATAAAPSTQPGIAARLEKIRELLDAGQYPVDLDLLASRIVDDEALRSRKPS